MNRKGLILFAREPLPGRVKTRLAQAIGEHAALELYRAMLLDVLEISRKLPDVDIVVYWDCEEKTLPLLAEIYQCSSRRQITGDLGQRMQAAFVEMFADGFESCCIIGSDAPDLPLSYIRDAYQLLENQRTDAVFGPSADGGYYLLGLKRLFPLFFHGIDWSTSHVLRQSLDGARTGGAVTQLLPVWHDIDTMEDLNAFIKRFRMLSTGGSRTADLATAL
ncbi:MAG: TIGR04282 family arsenosugar biosynthesis glycosyltransferase [Pseudomonadota bacterium]